MCWPKKKPEKPNSHSKPSTEIPTHHQPNQQCYQQIRPYNPKTETPTEQGKQKEVDRRPLSPIETDDRKEGNPPRKGSEEKSESLQHGPIDEVPNKKSAFDAGGDAKNKSDSVTSPQQGSKWTNCQDKQHGGDDSKNKSDKGTSPQRGSKPTNYLDTHNAFEAGDDAKNKPNKGTSPQRGSKPTNYLDKLNGTLQSSPKAEPAASGARHRDEKAKKEKNGNEGVNSDHDESW